MDNFNRETVNEYFSLTFSVPEDVAHMISGILNEDSGDMGSKYYKVVPENYIPYRFEY